MGFAEDPSIGIPPAPPLRIFEPPASYRQGRLPLDWAAAARPESLGLTINGTPFVLRRWSAEEWRGLPDRERPAGTLPGDRGGRYLFEPA